jgi:hypothetical protein
VAGVPVDGGELGFVQGSSNRAIHFQPWVKVRILSVVSGVSLSSLVLLALLRLVASDSVQETR